MNNALKILPREFRRRGAAVAGTLFLRALLNFVGLAVLLPVLALVLDPESLTGSGPLRSVYDFLGFTSPRHFALAVCGTVVAVITVKCLLNVWLTRFERNFIFDLYRTLSRRLYITYHDRGLPYVKSHNSAQLSRNINVVCMAFTAGVLRPAAAIVVDAILFILLFGALAVYTPLAAGLTVLVFLPGTWLYYGLIRNRIVRYGETENRAQREKVRTVAETFRGYADIEINGAFPMMLRSFDRAMDEIIRTRRKEFLVGVMPQLLTEIGLAVGMALLVVVSIGTGTAQGALLFGAFAVAALRLMPSVRSILGNWTAIKFNRYTLDILRDAGLDDYGENILPNGTTMPAGCAEENTTNAARTVEQIPNSAYSATNTGCAGSPANLSVTLDRVESSTNPAAAAVRAANPIINTDGTLTAAKLTFERQITIRDLTFRFEDGHEDVFNGFSLTIRKGERIGIRGASGAGKTTLFNLLLGLYEPTSGVIEIDDTPLTAANRRAWQNRIGYVSQSLFLIDNTFAANVALGIPSEEIDHTRVDEALRIAQLGEFIDGLPKGADTPVGECGCRLSGGQRQRIGIARALYRQADVLFFDEATSALDTRTEEEINHSIAGLAARRQGLTLIIIAHRETSLEYCDRIITIG